MQSNIGSQVDSFFFFKNIGDLIQQLVSAAIIVSAIGMAIYFVIGGINWLMSGGDKARLENAQKTITQSVIGFIIVTAAYAIFQLVTQIFGLQDMSI